MQIMDCTLRDGANVVGKGFDAELTKLMLEGMIGAGITTIEMGNALGIGAYESGKAIAPLSDIEYLELAQAYLDKAEIGMFMAHANGTEKNIDLAKQYHLRFLRVGANAGDGVQACKVVKRVKAAGMKCRYSLMKAYIRTANELAEEAKMLEDCGLDEITIMDSAGTMMPEQVEEYTTALVKATTIPVAFHGHNNLGLSIANALTAYNAGATVFDTGLLGMARSAGNCATELAVAAFQRQGLLKDIDLYALLNFLDEKLIPAMEKYDYHVAVRPKDLILGISGCHSSFEILFEKVAKEYGVPLYRLIVEVSAIDRKRPTYELLCRVAEKLQ